MTAQLGSVEVEVRANLAPLRAGFVKAQQEAKVFSDRTESALSSSTRGTQLLTSEVAGLGSQLATLGSMRGGVMALGAAFTSALIPAGLAGTAVGLVTNAVKDLFFATDSGAAQATEVLKRHEEAIRNLKDAWGEAGKGLQEYLDIPFVVAQDEAIQSQEELAGTIRERMGELVSLMNAGTMAVREQMEAAGELAPQTVENYAAWKRVIDAVDQVKTDLENGVVPNVTEFRSILADLRLSPDLPADLKYVIGLLADGVKLTERKFRGLGASKEAAAQFATGGPSMGPDWRGPALTDSGRLPEAKPPFEGNGDLRWIPPSGRRGGGSKRDPFADLMDRAADRKRVLEQDQHAFTLAGEALARYREEMRFLNAAQDDWSKLTEDQRAALEEQARQLGDSAAAAERLKDQQEALKEAQQQAEDAMEALGNSAENLFMGLIQGGDAAKQAIAQLAAELLKAALLGSGPLSWFFGGGLLGGGGGIGLGDGLPMPIGPSSVPRGVRAPGRMPAGARSAGSSHFAAPTIIIQGNADSAAMAQMEGRLRQFQREQARAADERAKNGWRVN